MKICRQEFNKIYSGVVTKKEYDKIISKIDDRFNEICNIILVKCDKGSWFDYGNCSYSDDSRRGYFDPEMYATDIEVGGENIKLPEPYIASFPTRWLYEDFQEEFEREKREFKEQQEKEKQRKKRKAEELKERKSRFEAIIRSKLTEEEISYIVFK